MARNIGPRFKMCRRLGLNVVGHPKAMNHSVRGSARSDKKLSDYGVRLLEKQRLKAYYGVLEKQFAKYVNDAFKTKNSTTGYELLVKLESRLDNMVYRMGFATSVAAARQMVNHGHMLVNGKKIDIPSYILSTGDVVSLREKSRKIANYLDAMEGNRLNTLPYLTVDLENFTGTFIRLPLREEFPVQIDENLIVEYYSR